MFELFDLFDQVGIITGQLRSDVSEIRHLSNLIFDFDLNVTQLLFQLFSEFLRAGFALLDVINLTAEIVEFTLHGLFLFLEFVLQFLQLIDLFAHF